MNRWLVLPGQPNSIAYAATNELLMRTKSTPTSTRRRQCIAKTWVRETGSSSCGRRSASARKLANWIRSAKVRTTPMTV